MRSFSKNLSCPVLLLSLATSGLGGLACVADATDEARPGTVAQAITPSSGVQQCGSGDGGASSLPELPVVSPYAGLLGYGLVYPGYGYPRAYSGYPGYSYPGYGSVGYSGAGYGLGYGSLGYGSLGYGGLGYGSPGYGSLGYGSLGYGLSYLGGYPGGYYGTPYGGWPSGYAPGEGPDAGAGCQ